jgi:hypothetical protein
MSYTDNNDDGTSSSVSARLRNNAVFSEEYDSWRRIGHKHQSAHRRAMDYHNKFTRHEITHDWVNTVDATLHHEDHTEDHIQFNQVVRILIGELTAAQQRLMWFLVVQEDLDINLDADLFAVCHATVGDARPETAREMAASMGLALNNIGVCTTLRAVRNRIRDKCESLGLRPSSVQKASSCV